MSSNWRLVLGKKLQMKQIKGKEAHRWHDKKTKHQARNLYKKFMKQKLLSWESVQKSYNSVIKFKIKLL